ncbi:hypothetical protein EJ110_NYTH36432 [Nymphaea thermarum]|nr:hypothetical protein EJ110_NYTH36432 [Nymphaea thermarum]
MLPSWDNAIILEEWRGPSCSIQDITGWGGYFMSMEKEKQFFGLKHIVPDPYADNMFVPIFCHLSKVPHWFGEEIHIKAAFDERIDWEHLRKWTEFEHESIEVVEEHEPYWVEHIVIDSDADPECRHDHPDHDNDSSCSHESCHLPQKIRTKKILVDESCFLWKEPRRPQMKMLSRVQSSRHSISEAGPSEISEIHAALIEHEVESSEENKEVSFPGIKKNDLYLVPGNLMKIQRSVKQTEVSLSIQGSGIRPVFLPFFTKEDVQGWVSKGYKFVHLGQIDVLVKPHFKYELNAPYLVSLLDVRHVDWKQALICQFTGELSKDGLCCVQPNFTLSLQDPYLLQAFVLCVQIKEVNLVAKSVYATITSRCTFNLLQSTLTSFRLDYGINFPLSMNKNIMQVGVEISNEGFLQGYPAIGEFLQRQKYKEKKAWQSIFSKYPEKHAHRQSQLQLQPSRALSLPPVLPTVRGFSEETSSPNRDSAVKMMMMTTPKAEQGESGASGTGYVVSGEWPPKMAYATTTSEELQKGTPEFRADIKRLFEVLEIEHDWDLIENEAEFEECLRNKNVFYLEEEDDEIKSIITDSSSEAAGHIYMVSKKGKEILITESESEPEEELEEFNCKSEFCNTFAPTSTSPYEIIHENSSNSENSTSESGSDIERGIYSDNEVPIAPQHQERKAVSDKVAKALLDKGTIPINFWEFTPKTSLRNSEIKQIKKMSLADISVIIPVQLAADKSGKWKKGHAFIDTGANMNFYKKEMISD